MDQEGTKADGKHVLAYCQDCGAMTTPVGDYWRQCACGGLYFLFPHVATRKAFQFKLTESDRRFLRCVPTGPIGTDGFA